MENQTLVALTPAEMPAAQSALVTWCEQKMAHLQTTVEDLAANLVIAQRNRWGSRKSLESALNRERKRIDYYEKIKAAIQAGYLLIPNFPVDAFAVRVTNESARWKGSAYVNDNLTDAQPTLAPAGEGRYVDDKKPYRDLSHKYPDQKNPGKMIEKRWFTSKEYDEVIDLPLVGLKPIVLQATERAMALRIFDTLGIVQERKRDPIIVGQIIDPRDKYGDRLVTFFVAWWLDLDSL